jgi:hypothetical protein
VERFGLLSACCVAFWMLSRPWSTAAAGFTTSLPVRWHPASWLSESYVIGRRTWQSVLAFISLAAVLFGTVLLPYPACFVAWLLALGYLLPLWHIFLDTLKRDHTVKSRRIILFQPRSPLNSKVEKKTDPNGRLIEIAPEVYWFMDKNDMAHLAGATADDKKLLTACRIAAGFYKSKVTNEFLQLFDSLSLYPFLVDHSNPKTMLALEDLARFFEGAKAGKVLSPNGRESDAPVSSAVTGVPLPRQSARRNPDRQPVDHGEPSAQELRGPAPKVSTGSREPDDKSAGQHGSAVVVERAQSGERTDNTADPEFDFAEGAESDALEENGRVIVAAPPPGQTNRAQDEELDSVRAQVIELPSGTATGPHGKGRRGSEKPAGGQKRPLRFKPKGDVQN